MPDRFRVLDYHPSTPAPSARRTTWRIILSALVSGMVAVLLLGYLAGEFHDWLWSFFAAGVLFGASVGYATRRRFLPRGVAFPAAILCFAVAGLIAVCASVSLFAKQNIFTGQRFDGIDALSLYLWIIVWILISLAPATLGALFLLLAARRSREL